MIAGRHSVRLGGFTLIELLTTIVVAAILLAVAAPSFVAFQRNSELTSAANSLLAAMNAARGEAMKRGMNAMVIPASGTDWSTGWTVFVDVNHNREYNEATDITVLKQTAIPSYFTATAQTSAGTATSAVMFDASGYSKAVGSAAFQSATLSIARNDLSGSQKSEQTRLLVIAVTGRVRVCKPASDSTCAVTATE